MIKLHDLSDPSPLFLHIICLFGPVCNVWFHKMPKVASLKRKVKNFLATILSIQNLRFLSKTKTIKLTLNYTMRLMSKPTKHRDSSPISSVPVEPGHQLSSLRPQISVHERQPPQRSSPQEAVRVRSLVLSDFFLLSVLDY